MARPALAVELQRVGGLTICVPARPEDLASLAESGSCSSPVWGRVWPAGEALALSLMEFPLQYMCSNASNLADVGAGIGVAGLAAAAAGAREVTLLEAEPLALDLASESAACMGCQAITRDGDPDWFFGADLCRGVTYSLHAADDEDGNQELPLAGTRLHLSCCDWNAAGADPRRAGKYDVVLASDVLYGGANEAASLAPSLAALLQEGGTLAVADPAKRTPSATRQAFIEAAAAAGMELTGASDITVDSESLLPEDEMDYSVLLMLFEKAGDAGK